jgi:hypothetical protein
MGKSTGVSTRDYSELNVQELREYFQYNPSTGDIFRNGKIAGVEAAFGSRQVYFRGRKYSTSVIAWVMHYEEIPQYQVCRRDGNLANVAIDNLLLYPEAKSLGIDPRQNKRGPRKSKGEV